jgi:hypothetical protein
MQLIRESIPDDVEAVLCKMAIVAATAPRLPTKLRPSELPDAKSVAVRSKRTKTIETKVREVLALWRGSDMSRRTTGRRLRCAGWHSRVRQSSPTRKSLLIFRNRVKPANQKYSASHAGQISRIIPPVSPIEGRSRSSRTCGEMRWTREARETYAP